MHQTPRSVLAALIVVTLLAGCDAPGRTAAPRATGPASTVPAATGPAATPPFASGPIGIFDNAELVISDVERLDADPALAALAAEAVNELGYDLLRTGTEGTSNAVLSPASIVLALAMARAGARGETAAEMDRVLRNVATDENAAWLAALDAALADRTGTFKDVNDKDTDVTLRIANAPFAQADYAWEEPYLDALASRFGAGVRLVDYIAKPEAARLTINGWVDGQTEHRIPELLEAGVIHELTRIVLVNAVYLKAAWVSPFGGKTTPAPFHCLDGSTIDVPLMHGSSFLDFAEGDGWFAVDIPYVGEQLSMLVIVPDDLPSFESSLDGPGLAAIVGGLDNTKVALAMPRFGIETKLGLNETLAELGMPRAFDEDLADFTGMTVEEQLFIAAVVHQANIDVDEAGTEASAATAAVVQAESMAREVTVDRPFLFALRDRGTGAILFLGRVVEPVER